MSQEMQKERSVNMTNLRPQKQAAVHEPRNAERTRPICGHRSMLLFSSQDMLKVRPPKHGAVHSQDMQKGHMRAQHINRHQENLMITRTIISGPGLLRAASQQLKQASTHAAQCTVCTVRRLINKQHKIQRLIPTRQYCNKPQHFHDNTQHACAAPASTTRLVTPGQLQP